ncbi:tetratricopeptide repeat protein [Leptospira inadai]|uniref:tetratricopeptide repeat protein n=1 Tax=Leptospira inadai TaxID=29506 RepID=UPI0011AF20B2|nr:tetratricopeptide repeat protein [Leptospira inadai]
MKIPSMLPIGQKPRLVVLLFLGFFLSLVGCGSMSSEEKRKTYTSAIESYKSNRIQEARQALERIYKDDPDFLDTALHLGKIYYYEKDFRNSEKILEEALESNPKNLNVWSVLLRCKYATAKDTSSKEKLLVSVEEFLRSDAENLDVLFIQGKLFEDLKRLDRAIMAYNQMRIVGRKTALAYARLSAIYSKDKKKSDAFKRMVDLFSNESIED